MLLLSVIPLATYGQNSSLNTFSPYTFYGIGDFATQGPGYIRSMGGAARLTFALRPGKRAVRA